MPSGLFIRATNTGGFLNIMARAPKSALAGYAGLCQDGEPGEPRERAMLERESHASACSVMLAPITRELLTHKGDVACCACLLQGGGCGTERPSPRARAPTTPPSTPTGSLPSSSRGCLPLRYSMTVSSGYYYHIWTHNPPILLPVEVFDDRLKWLLLPYMDT